MQQQGDELRVASLRCAICHIARGPDADRSGSLWKVENNSDQWRRDDYVQKNPDRFSIAGRSGSGQCSNRLPVRLHQVRQGWGNLFVQRHAVGGLRQVRLVRVREPDGPDHLFGFSVPVDERRQPALLLLWRHRFELQQQLFVEQQHQLELEQLVVE